ncbi:MAG: imelysin family protein, partial [Bacteroidota bacterium]
YGNGQSDSELITGFDQNRLDYLVLLVDELKTEFDRIVSEWTSTYRQEFISNDETSAGSPISLYYNGFVKDYENLKNFSIELPAGLTADQETPDGSLVPAFYSGITRDLIIEHFESSKNIYFGLDREGAESIGFEDYLETAVGGPQLITQTKEAIADIDAAIADLPEGRLSDNVASEKLVTLRDELQDNTANFKSSIVSLLGLTITFNSGDGD